MSELTVIKLGGALLDDASALAAVCDAVASLGAGCAVVVHGGGATADEWLAAFGVRTQRIGGLRATPDAALPPVVGALAGWTNARVVSALASRGVAAVGLAPTAAGLTRVTPAADPALGHVGRAEAGDGAAVRALLERGLTPVLHSIGVADDGRVLNVNADDVASAAGAALGASRLVLLTDVPGVLDASGSVAAALTGEEIEAMIASGAISGGMAPKARAAVEASRSCGAPVVIASWRDSGWTTGRGGTRVTAQRADAAEREARPRPCAAPC